jgi:hypothetical protein
MTDLSQRIWEDANGIGHARRFRAFGEPDQSFVQEDDFGVLVMLGILAAWSLLVFAAGVCVGAWV